MDRGPAFRPACPRTFCACRSVRQHLPADFARTNRMYQKIARQSSLIPFAEGRPTRRWRSSFAIPISPSGATPLQKPAQRKISNIYRRKPRSSRSGSQEFPPGFCNSLFSVVSLQGFQGLLPHLTQRTSITTCFPLPSTGRPIGHREAILLICNYLRVAHTTPVCKRHTNIAVAA